ncbi:MAG: hypothetical protein D6826_08640 [Alphaproteobacteria bacterium]|nr:MAG: hypothetical protein D6826_08640 [Alphaproteobacteria bacterium]
MKRLVLLIVLVLLLGAGGGAGWWFFLRPPPDEAGAQAEAGPVAPDEPLLGPNGIPLEREIELAQIVLPMLAEGKVRKHVNFIVAFELRRPMSVAEIENIRPRLRDAVIAELFAIFSFRHIQAQESADLPVVRERLLRVANRVLGPKRVSAVFVRHASITPLG